MDTKTIIFKDIFQPFDDLPCFSKKNLRIYFAGSDDALNERIKRALKKKRILELKRGFYVTNLYILKEPKKSEFREFIASKLRFPSYLSLEYVLSKYNLLTQATYPVTSITPKSNRSYNNFLGSFIYSNLKEEFFFGFEEVSFYGNSYFIATKAKAMFDYLYLKKNMKRDLKQEILEDLRINWENFSFKDFKVFRDYTSKSASKKMAVISKIIKTLYA